MIKMVRKILSLLISTFLLISCNQSQNKNNHYPIEEQINNIVLYLNNENSPYGNYRFTLYFFMSDINDRRYDTTFSFVYDIDKDTLIDIRIIENQLIITNVNNLEQQSIINLSEKLTDIFNDKSKNDWLVKDLRNEAIQHFSKYYGLGMSTYLKSFKIVNYKQNICFDVSIRSQPYVLD